MGVTVKDIAKKANVSTATVSNVLTQKKHVSDLLAQRVYDAVNALGYRPNHYARGLKTNRSYTIGIQIPDITNPYFGNAVKVIQTEAAASGYQVVLYNTGNVIATERQNIEGMLNAHVDGMICVAPRLGLESMLDTVHVPIIIVDRLPIQTNRNVAFVYSDNYSGAAAVAKYMIGKGYKHFLCLSGPINLVTNAKERLNGFTQTLMRNGIPKDDCRTCCGEFTFECGYSMLNDMLDTGLPMGSDTAAFVASDIMAWGAMEALKDRKMKIPQDMGIVGYDNIDFSNFLYPTLTTVENPIREMSHKAVHLLLDAMENDRNLEGMSIMANASLVERNSC